jgi:hypothetical protein
MPRVSCSHCHTMNDSAASRCQSCGHNPTKPRAQCDCPRCKPTARPRSEAEFVAAVRGMLTGRHREAYHA